MTESRPQNYQASVIASALRIYEKTGRKVNTAYTPTAMLRTATSITGNKYKRGEYLRAASDLELWNANDLGRNK